MRWLVPELQALLRQDVVMRILMVEGNFDITLWKHLVPIAQRMNVSVYSVGSVDVPIAEGGEKQRVVELARRCEDWPESARIRFFADADFDRFIPVDHPANLTLTDGRDAEAYALDSDVLACLCETGAGEPERQAETAQRVLPILLRPVGILRICDARNGWQLPFQETFAGGTIKRFFRFRRGEYSLQLRNMVDALIRRVDEPPALEEVLRSVEAEAEAQREISDWQVIHGKDLIAFFAWYFEIPLKVAGGLVALSIATSSHSVLRHENIGEVERWVRAS